MSKRLEKFRALKSDAWHGRNMKKLSDADRRDCERFIVDHDHLAPGQFEMALNRWYLDRPDMRGKNHSLKWALVSASNPRINARTGEIEE